jgi:hypothetical protein
MHCPTHGSWAHDLDCLTLMDPAVIKHHHVACSTHVKPSGVETLAVLTSSPLRSTVDPNSVYRSLVSNTTSPQLLPRFQKN